MVGEKCHDVFEEWVIMKCSSSPIWIYEGPGVEPQAYFRISRLLKWIHPSCQVLSITADSLYHCLKKESAALLIMPGGADLPFLHALKGEPNRLIRQFVRQGGSYLGICAGAYYASKEVLFEEGGALQVKGSRELCFFPGTAEGPAYGLRQFEYSSPRGARIARLSWGNRTVSAYFNGGCYFRNAADFPDCVNIIAGYSDLPETPAAIIGCRMGKGRAILSGVHLEVEPEEICLQTPNVHAMKKNLSDGFSDRLALFSSIMNWLL